MAQTTFHVNLTNQRFPHNFDELGSTIIAAESQMEQNQRISGAFSGNEAEESAGICQAYFMQNCMPTTRGYSSVSFLNVLPPIPGVSAAIDKMYVLRGDSNNIAIFAPLGSTQYVYDPSNGAWEEFEIATLDPAPPVVAYLKSRTFVFYPNIGIYEYDFVAKEFVEQQFEGISAGNILGVCAAGSVLVAWDDNTIYRSSVNDPLDFVPSLSTGAGADSVLAIKGEIITCQPLGQDFVIYTAANSVVAVQTNNVQIPFTYSEIPGSCGVASPDHVTQDTNRGIHVTWCASGFQQINRQEATYIWPELSNGIIRGLMSEYDSQFGWPHLVSYNQLDVRLSFVGNRWIVVSIRDANDDLGGYTSAFVFDSSLNRWGRFDVRHRNFIDFVNPHIGRAMTYAELAEEWPTYQDMLGLPYSTYARKELISAPRSGTNFGVVLANGAVYRASYYQTGQKEETVFGIAAAQPKLILGKFKTFRTRGTMLHSFKVQRLEPGVSIRALLHSYTGQYVGTKQGFVENERHEGQFFGRANADSFSLEFAGHFHVTDLVISTGNAGRINQRRGTLEDQVFCVYNDEDCVHNKDDFCVIVGGPEGYAVYGSKTALRILHEQGTLLNEEDYTPETWAPFAQEMLDAQAVLDGPPTTQEIIDQAYDELQAAMDALVPLFSDFLSFIPYGNTLEPLGPVFSVVEKTNFGAKFTLSGTFTKTNLNDNAVEEITYTNNLLPLKSVLDGAVYEIEFVKTTSSAAQGVYPNIAIGFGTIFPLFPEILVLEGIQAGSPLSALLLMAGIQLEYTVGSVVAFQLFPSTGRLVFYVDGVQEFESTFTPEELDSMAGRFLQQWNVGLQDEAGLPVLGEVTVDFEVNFRQVNHIYSYPDGENFEGVLENELFPVVNYGFGTSNSLTAGSSPTFKPVFHADTFIQILQEDNSIKYIPSVDDPSLSSMNVNTGSPDVFLFEEAVLVPDALYNNLTLLPNTGLQYLAGTVTSGGFSDSGKLIVTASVERGFYELNGTDLIPIYTDDAIEAQGNFWRKGTTIIYGRYAKVSASYSYSPMWVSNADGQTWAPASIGVNDGFEAIHQITKTGDTATDYFVMLTTDPNIYVSQDGITWTLKNPPSFVDAFSTVFPISSTSFGIAGTYSGQEGPIYYVCTDIVAGTFVEIDANRPPNTSGTINIWGYDALYVYAIYSDSSSVSPRYYRVYRKPISNLSAAWEEVGPWRPYGGLSVGSTDTIFSNGSYVYTYNQQEILYCPIAGGTFAPLPSALMYKVLGQGATIRGLYYEAVNRPVLPWGKRGLVSAFPPGQEDIKGYDNRLSNFMRETTSAIYVTVGTTPYIAVFFNSHGNYNIDGNHVIGLGIELNTETPNVQMLESDITASGNYYHNAAVLASDSGQLKQFIFSSGSNRVSSFGSLGNWPILTAPVGSLGPYTIAHTVNCRGFTAATVFGGNLFALTTFHGIWKFSPDFTVSENKLPEVSPTTVAVVENRILTIYDVNNDFAELGIVAKLRNSIWVSQDGDTWVEKYTNITGTLMWDDAKGLLYLVRAPTNYVYGLIVQEIPLDELFN